MTDWLKSAEGEERLKSCNNTLEIAAGAVWRKEKRIVSSASECLSE